MTTLAIIFCLFMFLFLFIAFLGLGKVELAKRTLNDVMVLYENGVITPIQAKVFLNDLEDPFDVRSVLEVRHEIDAIVERQLKEIEINQNTNR